MFLRSLTLGIVSVFSTLAWLQAADVTPSIAGNWALEAVDNIAQDGTRVHLYGSTPKGWLSLDVNGRYALQIVNPEHLKFASGDKSKGTEEELKSLALGSNAHFGHYRIDPSKQTITFAIDYASFANWDGITQVRPYTLLGDRLVYVVPAPTTGKGVISEVVWRRLATGEKP